MKLLSSSILLLATSFSAVNTTSAFTTTTPTINSISIAKNAHVRRHFTHHDVASIALDGEDTDICSSSIVTSTQQHQQQAISASASPLTQTTNDVHFPPPLTKLERIQRAASFWVGTAPIALSYFAKSAELNVREAVIGQQSLTKEEEEVIWNELHSKGAQQLADTIISLKGFYVKAAQIIGTRRDLFPKQYTDALSVFTDNIDPLPAHLIKAVIEEELCHDVGETFDDIFAEFDEVPLGAASVAQVHRAVLTEKHGGKEVAIKVQRPSIESKLMGDILNLKQIAKLFRDMDLPLDYYTVFSELELQLADEFDFTKEAASMERIYTSLTTDEYGNVVESPIVMPRPVDNLVSKRVLVMDYLHGTPLSGAAEVMAKKGIKPDSPESQLFARKLLKSLTAVFGRTILEKGYFHADPHPGNIFILDADGRIGLIDFGQVKQIGDRFRESLAKVVIALDERKSDDNPDDLERIGNLAQDLGIELKDDAPPNGHAAIAMWLLDGSVEEYPTGYSVGELSTNSPVKAMKSFPNDLVLVARNTVLVKAMAHRFGIPWSLSQQWAPTARGVLGDTTNQSVADIGNQSVSSKMKSNVQRIKTWGKRKASKILSHLPSPMRSKAASIALRLEQRKELKKTM